MTSAFRLWSLLQRFSAYRFNEWKHRFSCQPLRYLLTIGVYRVKEFILLFIGEWPKFVGNRNFDLADAAPACHLRYP